MPVHEWRMRDHPPYPQSRARSDLIFNTEFTGDAAAKSGKKSHACTSALSVYSAFKPMFCAFRASCGWRVFGLSALNSAGEDEGGGPGCSITVSSARRC
jgi:hypothetical protein